MANVKLWDCCRALDSKMEMMTQNLDLKSVQGLKRVPSSNLRLVDFLAEVTFNSHLPSGQGSTKCESCMPKGQAGIQVFWVLASTFNLDKPVSSQFGQMVNQIQENSFRRLLFLLHKSVSYLPRNRCKSLKLVSKLGFKKCHTNVYWTFHLGRTVSGILPSTK